MTRTFIVKVEDSLRDAKQDIDELEKAYELGKAEGQECDDAISRPKTGHWIKISPAGIYECSECGQNVMTNDICAYKFCHGCGVKMVESQESEKINCKSTKCENCQNHNYCDYEPQERSDKE